MEVMPGYKQTDAGVIPEDWDVRRLQDVAVANWGNTSITKATYQESGYQAYSASGPDGFVGWFEHEAPAVVISAIGALCGKTWLTRTNWTPIKNTIWFRAKEGEADTAFLYRITSNPSFWPSRGQAQPFIALGDVRNALIPLPPTRVEQETIAKTLGDTDALVESLRQLLAKKRQLKQGTMQELLTGKRRVPGFSGGWVVKRLGQLAEIRSGGTPSTTEPQFWDGDVLWCTPTDITSLRGVKYLSDTSRKISQLGLHSSSAEIVPANSVVMTSRATIGECAINRLPVSTNQGFKNFTPFENVDVEFLYYLLLTQRQGFVSLCGGSTFLEIGKAQLAVFEVRVPIIRAEQSAIAAILSDMDVEIAALESRLVKARQLRQGMMQELLTGRIRLV